jgi:hypothetical protein
LRAPDFVSAEEHWHSSRNQQGEEKVLDLALAHCVDSKIGCRAFNTVVVAEVRIATIHIVFSVGFVVLMLVTHQIM